MTIFKNNGKIILYQKVKKLRYYKILLGGPAVHNIIILSNIGTQEIIRLGDDEKSHKKMLKNHAKNGKKVLNSI